MGSRCDAGRKVPTGRQRHARAGSHRLCGEVPVLSWAPWQRRNDFAAPRWSRHYRKERCQTVAHHWQLLALRPEYLRLHPPIDAYYDSKSLTNDEVYAVTAYLLRLNGLIGETDTMNAQTLAKVEMPW